MLTTVQPACQRITISIQQLPTTSKQQCSESSILHSRFPYSLLLLFEAKLLCNCCIAVTFWRVTLQSSCCDCLEGSFVCWCVCVFCVCPRLSVMELCDCRCFVSSLALFAGCRTMSCSNIFQALRVREERLSSCTLAWVTSSHPVQASSEQRSRNTRDSCICVWSVSSVSRVFYFHPGAPAAATSACPGLVEPINRKKVRPRRYTRDAGAFHICVLSHFDVVSWGICTNSTVRGLDWQGTNHTR